jgi:metallo-beta-lactamase family protein
MLLSFCGAAGTVTGSCYLLQTEGCRFLVDCGMFQGPKSLKELNYGPFPFDPRKIDFVLLTHAHIDHSGLLPKLVKQGFRGPIFATGGTADLLGYMLPDSGAIQEQEVRRLNRRNQQRGRDPVEPIYTEADARTALGNFSKVTYESWFQPGDGVRARYWNAGHILGAASIEVEIATGQGTPRVVRILFSGDIGPEHKLFHPDPEAPANLDYVCCEGTYGGRPRTDADPATRREILAGEVEAALARGGKLLIPAFAVERTQELLYDLSALFDSGRIPKLPVFLDSPLAIKVGRYGKFIGCTGYPDCRHIEPLHKPESTGVGCPECGEGELVKRRSRRGKFFYSCSRYPKCRYALWNPPLAEPCPECRWPLLTVKTTKRRGTEKVCPQKDCGFAVPAPDLAEAEASG